MSAIIAIGWFIWLLISIAMVFEFVGYRALTAMFPEGQRNWHLWAQIGSLAMFAVCVLCHPFGPAQ